MVRARLVAQCVCVLAFVLFVTTLTAGESAAQPAGQKPPDAQGKVVTATGTVQHTAAKQEQWTPAKVFQPLYVAERVRTLTASRAAILFIDETQVKLNAGAVLTVREIKRAGGPATEFELQAGEAWFRTKNPRAGVTVQTPAAAAAIRGTEINVAIRPNNETVLTVVEGSVEFFNPAGSIMVNAGEEGSALPGQAPTKRVILNPENAVQWALYYPIDAAFQGLPAAQLLASGDVAGARREIDAALAANPQAVPQLVLLSTIELRTNKVGEAVSAAERALAVDRTSVPALIAASEAEQGRFDLDAARRYLDRALQIDPKNVHALVNRARIKFGIGDTDGADEDAGTAAAIAPDDAQVRSLRGFIRLGKGDIDGARGDFEAASRVDTEFGEPHLGLGLIHFRENNVNDGLLEMLTATLLEPNVSLYQSYLGKAYYQVRRFTEGLAALDSAKRLDPRDPTPWLYSSLFLRDQNRQIDALNDLRTAIRLNDNRAVYRSRLLLDRDLATKNVSIAEIYRQLGFEAWGAFEALNSLEADFTNASAHLFMADTYSLLPDRTQALGGELLQYFLHAPVNRNSFNTFSEYTSLLEQPRKNLDVSTETGSRERTFADISHRAGNERFAYAGFIQGQREESYRLDRPRDDRFQGFFQGKVSFTPSSDLFFNYSGVRNEYSQSDEAFRAFGIQSDTPILVRQFRTPNPRIGNRFTIDEYTLGFRQQWRPGSSFTASARYSDLEQTTIKLGIEDDFPCLSFEDKLQILGLGFASTSTVANPYKSYDLQAQQTTRVGRHQIIVGQQMFSQDKADNCSEIIRHPLFPTLEFPFAASYSGKDRALITYVRDEIDLNSRVHLTIGMTYQDADYWDLVDRETTTRDRWNPLVGASLRVAPGLVVRASAFSNLNTNFIGNKIAPPTVAGFVLERNELPVAERNEYSASIEASRGRVFAGMRTFFRDTEVPHLIARDSFIPDADLRQVGTSAFLNWIVARRFSVFADNQLVRVDADAFNRYDNLLRGGINFIHEKGLFVRVTGRYIRQTFDNTLLLDELPRNNFGLGDVSVTYEFARKRGRLSFLLTNLFEQEFDMVLEGLSLDKLVPRRRAYLTMRWRLF